MEKAAVLALPTNSKFRRRRRRFGRRHDRKSGFSRWRAAKSTCGEISFATPRVPCPKSACSRSPRRDGDGATAGLSVRIRNPTTRPCRPVPRTRRAGRGIAGWTKTSTGEAFGQCSCPPFSVFPYPIQYMLYPFAFALRVRSRLLRPGFFFLWSGARRPEGTQKEGEAKYWACVICICERSVSRRRVQ